ncbi:hypothetical protein VP1G_07672 [Cytospora mali]|uniref:Uncharacterized protein n=1 Tax=Cytospora mali TaxID=578113 RepID=A0A194V9B4_CYTMA|nr:hypothetical protein VP1G_07672 [Valsa mali var. pyri (nom. inval.)]
MPRFPSHHFTGCVARITSGHPEVHVAVQDGLRQRRVDLRVPLPGHKTPPLPVAEVDAQTGGGGGGGSLILVGCDDGLREAPRHPRRHRRQVRVLQPPVQPDDLDAGLAAVLDGRQQRGDGGEAVRVRTAGWVEEEVLHVDDDEDGLGWGDQDVGVGWSLGSLYFQGA